MAKHVTPDTGKAHNIDLYFRPWTTALPPVSGNRAAVEGGGTSPGPRGGCAT